MSLTVSPINNQGVMYTQGKYKKEDQTQQKSSPAFQGNDNDEYYNPVSRTTEKWIAGINSVLWGSAVGAGVGYIASTFAKEGSKMKIGGIVGGVVGVATAAVVALSKIYNANVKATMKEKQMDVFVRERSAASSIAEELDRKMQEDPENNIDEVVDNYVKMQMANNSRGGVLLMGA